MNTTIRNLIAADIPFGLQLCAQNRWNQLEADWHRQLDLEPTGCFLAERAGVPIGTACCCVFGDIAWINLVLVDRAQRGQGVGAALMRHVVQHLDDLGVASIRLDATPLGQPIYEKLGFTGDFSLTRYQGVMSAHPPEGGTPTLAGLADLPAIAAMDEAITGTRREKLLRHLLDASPDHTRKLTVNGNLHGYSFARPGANAWHVGPIQGSAAATAVLFQDAALRYAGQSVYFDVPTDNAAAVALVQSIGLTPQRSFLRMTRGRRVREDLTRSWCTFGPEKG